MKRILYALAVAALLSGAVSCKKDFMNVSPVDQFGDGTVWNDQALIQTFVNNIYSGVPHGFSNIMMASISDESMYNADFGTSNITKSLVTPSDQSIFAANYWCGNRLRLLNWENAYKFVRSANLFFEKIDNAPVEAANKDKMKGEVHFLRAYLYHNLVSMYGGVPIITKSFGLNDDFAVPRDSYENCIKFITEECDKAAALLPLTQSSADKGRATKGAALALKARVLLHAASDFYNSNGSWAGSYANKELIGYVGGDRTARWQAAKNAAKAVMDLGQYALYMPNPADQAEAEKNYGDIFLKNETSEDIFVRYFTTKVDEQWHGYNPGLYNAPNGYHGWGSNTPIGQLVDAYEMKDGTSFSWSNPAHAAEPYKNREPRFYASILYEGAKWRQRPADVVSRDPVGKIQVGFWEKWNASANKMEVIAGLDTRKSPIEDWNGTYTGYFLKKFMDPTVDAQFTKQTQPWRYIRYTEIVLNYVEACLALGQEAEAKTYLNMIRKRAGMPDVTESGQALINRYRHERQIELAYEDHRYYDVRRWMTAPQAYTNAKGVDVRYKLNPDKTTSATPTYSVIDAQQRAWNNRFYFLPINIDELNRNNKLIQNPLY
jgi:hypothetical protein